MPEMTMLGWFHTVLGVVAVLSGFYTIYKYRVISVEEVICICNLISCGFCLRNL